jgi:hypothetical protein
MGRRLALVASEHPPVSLPPPSPSGPAHRGWPLTVATSGSPTTAMVRCRKSRSGNAAVHCAGRGNSRQPTCQRRTGVYDAPRTPGTGVRSRISVCILFTQRWLVPLRVPSQRGVTQRRFAGSTNSCHLMWLADGPVREDVHRFEAGLFLFLEASSPLLLPSSLSLSPRVGRLVW